MILELDVGNTRIKWRQLGIHSGQALQAGAVAGLEELIAMATTLERPEFVRLCSVRADEACEKFRQFSAVTWGLEVQQARVTRSCAGVTNQYEDLSRLGVDRWLAMLAAYNRSHQACLIVDSGTAVTVDAIAGDGLHLGGYIVPGRKLMADSLQNRTRIRILQEPDRITAQPGHGTEAAVLNGALASHVALVERTLNWLRQREPELTLYLAGGDAELLAPELDTADSGLKVEMASALVLDGLAYACPWQES